MLTAIGDALWFILPSYMANTTPIFVRRLNLLSTPVDFRLSWMGRRLLGDNKTWRGVLLGTAAGALIALLQGRGLAVGVLLGFGALLGDMAGSFVKRRLNVTPGHPNVLLDQTPYVIVPLLLYSAAFEYPLSAGQSLFLILFSMAAHRLSNVVYFWLGIKDVPY